MPALDHCFAEPEPEPESSLPDPADAMEEFGLPPICTSRPSSDPTTARSPRGAVQDPLTPRVSRRAAKRGKKGCSGDGVELGTPRLPSIETSSVGSLTTSSQCSSPGKRVPRPRERDRAALVRSPSCPQLWSDYDTDAEGDHSTVQEGDLGASIHPRMTRGPHSQSLKLPAIYSHHHPQAGGLSPGAVTPRKSIDRDLRRLAARRSDPALTQTPQDAAVHRQTSQPSALLLPIRDYSLRKKPRDTSRRPETQHQARADRQNSSTSADSGLGTDKTRLSEPSEASQPWGGWDTDQADDQCACDAEEYTESDRQTYEHARGELGSGDKCREWLKGHKRPGAKKPK